jgi:hypothetical protein
VGEICGRGRYAVRGDMQYGEIWGRGDMQYREIERYAVRGDMRYGEICGMGRYAVWGDMW